MKFEPWAGDTIEISVKISTNFLLTLAYPLNHTTDISYLTRFTDKEMSEYIFTEEQS